MNSKKMKILSIFTVLLLIIGVVPNTVSSATEQPTTVQASEDIYVSFSHTTKQTQVGESFFVRVEMKKPGSYYLVWRASSDLITAQPQYTGCEVQANAFGRAQLTAQIVDEKGNVVASDTLTVKVKPSHNMKADGYSDLFSYIGALIGYMVNELFPFFYSYGSGQVVGSTPDLPTTKAETTTVPETTTKAPRTTEEYELPTIRF